MCTVSEKLFFSSVFISPVEKKTTNLVILAHHNVGSQGWQIPSPLSTLSRAEHDGREGHSLVLDDIIHLWSRATEKPWAGTEKLWRIHWADQDLGFSLSVSCMSLCCLGFLLLFEWIWIFYTFLKNYLFHSDFQNGTYLYKRFFYKHYSFLNTYIKSCNTADTNLTLYVNYISNK